MIPEVLPSDPDVQSRPRKKARRPEEDAASPSGGTTVPEACNAPSRSMRCHSYGNTRGGGRGCGGLRGRGGPGGCGGGDECGAHAVRSGGRGGIGNDTLRPRSPEIDADMILSDTADAPVEDVLHRAS